MRFTHFISMFLLFSFQIASADWQASPWKELPHGQARIIVIDEESNQYALELDLEEKWHSYWKNPGDSGAPPELFHYSSSEQQKVEIQYPYPEEIFVDPIMTYGYEEEAVYFFELLEPLQKIRADLLICKDICIPGSIEVNKSEFPMEKISKAEQSLVESFQERIPQSSDFKASFSPSLKNTHWQITRDKDFELLNVFWYPEQVESLEAAKLIRVSGNQYNFLSKDNFKDKKAREAVITYKSKGQVLASKVAFLHLSPNLFPFFLMAFLGGLILNLMPCVFPIVSLKAFSIVKAIESSEKNIRQNQFAYSFGVLFSFIALAFVLVSLRASGQFVGWGFQLQDIGFVGFLALLFFILGLNFFDLWSIDRIPGFATKKIANKDERIKAFLTGLLAVVVASPCTAPFMGAAIGFALSQSSQAILFIFSGLGIGMAFPFLIFGLLPKAAKLLPRPGNWMVVFKKAMGFLLIATSVWLVWLATQLASTSKTKDASYWQNFKVENWAELSDTSSARFVSFTADWCVTCKVNEKLVFQDDEVQKFFKNEKIKTYKVDWTKRDSATGMKLAEYGRAGIPLYLFFPKGSKQVILLPELLTSSVLIESIQNLKNSQQGESND
ncbi:MAG: thioredoxin family protein [Bdellovibrionota bacterium]|nr:thioredoxin family protein [Bdellovibrionota bacterium]